VGGLYFDDLRERGDEVLAFQADLAARLLDVYLLILGRRVDLPHTSAERVWQEVRRGRYAEFNLVWDRGTRFGLETSGRVESILASLPPRVRWTYDHVPEPGTAEERLVELVRSPPRNWI
jgi:coproporphyrinogen III oxidase